MFTPGQLAAIRDSAAGVVHAFAGWGDWKQIEGGKWKSPGGRVLSDAAYQKLSKGKAGSPAPAGPPTPPEPRDEMPLPKPAAARRSLVGKLGGAFAAAGGEAAPQWHRAAARVVSSLPDRAARLATRVRSVVVVNSQAEFVEAVRRFTGRDPADLAADLADTHGIYLPSSRSMIFQATPVRLSGGIDPMTRVRGFVAHELAHVVDDGGPAGKRFSSTPEWRRAWGELEGGSLSRYAGTSAGEGFVEFARAAWSGNVPLDELAKKFPKAAGFFRDNGLWPSSAEARDPARARLARAVKAGYSPGAGTTVLRRIRRTLGFSEVYRYAGWGDWKPDGPGHMKSPGGRRLTNTAFQKLSKGRGTSAPAEPQSQPAPPAEPQKPEEKPGLIRRAWNATYGAAKERYGPRTAGAMAAAVALPIPGSILAVPALAAVGEIDRALTGGPKKPEPPNPSPAPPPNPVPPKKPAGKPDPALAIARAKAEVARAAHREAAKPGSGEAPDRIAWLDARARKAEDDLKKLGG